MTQLPPELQTALQHQRLLIVWGSTAPFELPPRVTGERAVLINRLIADAAKLPAARVRLSVTPPLPILSLDPTDRIEREFQAAGRALRVVTSSQDSATPTRHTLIKLAGDLNSRTGLILSRDEVQRLREDEDKRYLLDLVRQIVEGGAVIIVQDFKSFPKLPKSDEDFQVWWSILRPAFGSAPIFAVGEPSRSWPREVTYLGSVQDVVHVAFANVKAPIPKIESTVPFDVTESEPTTARRRDADNQAKQIEPGGDMLERDKIEVQTLRVDAAVPEQVFVNRVFDLAVAVRQMTSPPLDVKDLKHVESGEVQIVEEKGAPLINLRVEVDAPGCALEGKQSIQFRLLRGRDAPPIYFHLKPLRVGELSIVVTNLGIFGIAAIVGPALGPILGGWLVDQNLWRFIFFINPPVGIIGILLGTRLLREHPSGRKPSLDIYGLITEIVGFGAVLYAASIAANVAFNNQPMVNTPELVLFSGHVAYEVVFKHGSKGCAYIHWAPYPAAGFHQSIRVEHELGAGGQDGTGVAVRGVARRGVLDHDPVLDALPVLRLFAGVEFADRFAGRGNPRRRPIVARAG